MARFFALLFAVCLASSAMGAPATMVDPVGQPASGTIKAVTVAATSGLALAAGNRIYLVILNQDAAKTIACNFGGTAVINGAGSFTFAPNGGGYVWDGAAVIPNEAINCIASVAGATLTIQVK